MPFQTVASASTGGFFFGSSSYFGGYGGRGGLCALPRLICSCAVLVLLVGFGLTIAGFASLSNAWKNQRALNVKVFNSDIASWAGTSSLAFTSGAYTLKVSNGTTTLKKTEIKYDTQKEFGDDGKDLTKGWTSIEYVSPSQQYSMATPSTVTLSIESKSKMVSGPFSFEETTKNVWTCNNKEAAATGATCNDGNNCGLDYDSNGCPPSSSSWNPKYGSQWYHDLSTGNCVNYDNCYCECTSGRRNGRRYRTSGYNGYDIDCLNNINQFCGYPSRAVKRCSYQRPVKNTCKNECTSTQKGKWDTTTGQCQVRKALANICLVSDEENENTNFRANRLFSGASPPPESSGCIWDSSRKNFVPTTYVPVPYDSKDETTRSFQVKLISGKDPWYLATLLTKGCNFASNPSNCFGESQLSLASRGLMFLIFGVGILCCPCITYFCCFREKSKSLGYGTNYSNAPQPQINTMYQPIAQPPKMVQQQGGYNQPSYPTAQPQQPVAYVQQPVAYAQQPVAYAQQPVAYAQQY